ncbi:calpain-9-like isoform X1 [Branchiostoma floridae]|uniref:Calpain-9-like isoform X1 n=1 Tax=Branchiostoma floridae TaxID=7739 RepID=A0A9J7NBC5_BRAFL|nr:calpain-9-like isoform X1 [Branchiostoma floridae]
MAVRRQQVGVNVDALRERCFRDGVLFKDDEFPASDRSISPQGDPRLAGRQVFWRRPKELTNSPQLGSCTDSFDVDPGELGSARIVASMSSVCQNSKLFRHAVQPELQGFSEGYCGLFSFRLWGPDGWTEVAVDDRLPTIDGKLVFAHSVSKRHFWASLLEKAYAKLLGSYAALRELSTTDAVEDWTGGISEVYFLKEKLPGHFFSLIQKAFERYSLLSCYISSPEKPPQRKLTASGLYAEQAYAISALAKVRVRTPRGDDREIPLLRLRSPHGETVDWKGSWSEESIEWKSISNEQREMMGLTFDSSGEVWMALDDFVKQFTYLEICHVPPEVIRDQRKRWVMAGAHGQWTEGLTAGGCSQVKDTFWINPQFRLHLVENDKDANPGEEPGCSCVISLRQRQRRGKPLRTIGFAVYNPKGARLPLGPDFFSSHASVARSAEYVSLRQVARRVRLPAAEYIIVPSTYDPHEDGLFSLRVCSGSNAVLRDVLDKPREMTVQVQIPLDPEKLRGQEEVFRQYFYNVSGEAMEVTPYQLVELLNIVGNKDMNQRHFTLKACRHIVALRDVDHRGTMSYEEFRSMLLDTLLWKHIFNKYDRAKCDAFPAMYLGMALQDIGFLPDSTTLTCLYLMFADEHHNLSFESFVLCACRLKSSLAAYRRHQDPLEDSAKMDLRQVNCIKYIRGASQHEHYKAK